MTAPAPVLDVRDAAAVRNALIRDADAFVPGWQPGSDTTGGALLDAASRLIAAYIVALNRSPEKHELAFLDMLGIDQLPAQAARAGVVFSPIETGRDATAPQGTRLGGTGTDGQPIEFETEQAVAVAAARLVELRTVLPAQDASADHTAAALAGRPFTLFDELVPAEHALYLGDPAAFLLPGNASLELDVDLGQGGAAGLGVTWEYFDGERWRAFGAVSHDGTAGLTRSGLVHLVLDCGGPAETQVNGITSRWIRARLARPLPPDATRVLPQVRRLRASTRVERPPAGHDVCAEGLLPDQGVVEGQTLDLTKTFYPLGRQPRPGAACYLSNEEAFGRVGAQITVCVQRAVTQEELTAGPVAEFEGVIATARGRMADAAHALGDALLVLAPTPPARNRVQTLGAILDTLGNLQFNAGSLPLAQLLTAARAICRAVRQIFGAFDIGAHAALNGYGTDFVLINHIDTVRVAADTAVTAVAMIDVLAQFQQVCAEWDAVVPLDLTLYVVTNDQNRRLFVDVQDNAVAAWHAARHLADALQGLAALDGLTAEQAARSSRGGPDFGPPVLRWEYWDGSAWRAVPGMAAGAPDGRDLATGTFTFTVPDDWETSDLSGTRARWLRVRLASGSFDRLRAVTWFDTDSGRTNYVPFVESRPPALDVLRIGYLLQSPFRAPSLGWTHNDFAWLEVGDQLPGGGTPVTPFVAMTDTDPAVYCGFDRPLPADSIGMLIAAEEDSERDGPRLVWECWADTAWVRLSADDESAGFARSGIVTLRYPGVRPSPRAAIRSTAEDRVMLVDPRDANRFVAGDRLHVSLDERHALVDVRAVGVGELVLRHPLAGDFAGGSIGWPLPPRFGTPRTWVRARLGDPGDPLHARVLGLWLNAVNASHRRTVRSEVLGGSDGTPGQVAFVREAPLLPGIDVEVRELEGPRATIEGPVFREELRRAGVADADVREVEDQGRVREIWVRWHARPFLFFSQPESRHFMVDRTLGRVVFGDDRHGQVPLAGVDNILARSYAAGGGARGNVGHDKITDILSGVLARGVTNPLPAAGGADAESYGAILRRGPLVLRHRMQAITPGDYEAMAREASPEVALARVLPCTGPDGRHVPGWVTVVIVPQSADPEPIPSLELRRRVRAFLLARTPAALGGRLRIIGPRYLRVGALVVVQPAREVGAGAVRAGVELRLRAFLHPLTGGPAGEGWPAGRDLFASDVAAMVESSDGVDFASTVELLIDGQPQPLRVAVPEHRVVSAGSLDVRLAGGSC